MPCMTAFVFAFAYIFYEFVCDFLFQNCAFVCVLTALTVALVLFCLISFRFCVCSDVTFVYILFVIFTLSFTFISPVSYDWDAIGSGSHQFCVREIPMCLRLGYRFIVY